MYCVILWLTKGTSRDETMFNSEKSSLQSHPLSSYAWLNALVSQLVSQLDKKNCVKYKIPQKACQKYLAEDIFEYTVYFRVGLCFNKQCYVNCSMIILLEVFNCYLSQFFQHCVKQCQTSAQIYQVTVILPKFLLANHSNKQMLSNSAFLTAVTQIVMKSGGTLPVTSRFLTVWRIHQYIRNILLISCVELTVRGSKK